MNIMQNHACDSKGRDRNRNRSRERDRAENSYISTQVNIDIHKHSKKIDRLDK